MAKGFSSSHPLSQISCSLAGVCAGCGWIKTPFSYQRAQKEANLGGIWRGPIEWADLPTHGLRDKIDLVCLEGRLGLWNTDRREIQALDLCPQMTPALQSWFHAFAALSKSIPSGVRKGSLRLRVGPQGNRGVWLDFANEDVKHLLDEKHWLKRVLEAGVVEVGQRRKRLVVREAAGGEFGLKLVDPVQAVWNETWDGEAVVPLESCVGSFTQVGHTANRELVETVLATLPEETNGDWLELGAGNGNLTMGLARRARVVAVENDPLAVSALERAKGARAVTAVKLDFYHPRFYPLLGQSLEKLGQSLPSQWEGIVADPPRSGLGAAIDGLVFQTTPKWILYVACSTQSLVADAVSLQGMGYRIDRVRGVDLFPQTPHAEWVVLFHHSRSDLRQRQ